MADSIYLSNLIPFASQFPLLAGYDDGAWPDAAAIAAQFGGKTVIRITAFASDDIGDCLDVETGDATPDQAPAWVQRRRADGHGGPLVYCSWSLLPTVQSAFSAAGVPYPGFWVAGYPAPDGDAIPPGCVGHQWIDRGPYDESIMVDYLPGIDPPPAPTPTPISQTEENMIARDKVTGGVWVVRSNADVYAFFGAPYLGPLPKYTAQWGIGTPTCPVTGIVSDDKGGFILSSDDGGAQPNVWHITSDAQYAH